VARIFDVAFNKLLETQITDKSGRYAFLVGHGVFYITVEKPGYGQYRSGTLDLARAGSEEAVKKDIRLKKGTGSIMPPAAPSAPSILSTSGTLPPSGRVGMPAVQNPSQADLPAPQSGLAKNGTNGNGKKNGNGHLPKGMKIFELKLNLNPKNIFIGLFVGFLLLSMLGSAGKTANMYGSLRPSDSTDGSRSQLIAERLRAGKPTAANAVYNAFEQALRRVDPAYAQQLDELPSLGGPHLCGSGPAIFYLLESDQPAGPLATALAAHGMRTTETETLTSEDALVIQELP